MAKSKTPTELIYVGEAYLSGIPARDLSPTDLDYLATRQGIETEALIAELIASGLYALPAQES